MVISVAGVYCDSRGFSAMPFLLLAFWALGTSGAPWKRFHAALKERRDDEAFVAPPEEKKRRDAEADLVAALKAKQRLGLVAALEAKKRCDLEEKKSRGAEAARVAALEEKQRPGFVAALEEKDTASGKAQAKV